MELILTMDESDGDKRKSNTVHTQTDFGPYSAFPPPGYKIYYDNHQHQNITDDGHKVTPSDDKHMGKQNHLVRNNIAASTDMKEITENEK